VGQLQKGKVNTYSLANGRVAGFANAKESMGTSCYIVAASIDGSDKRSARIFMGAEITLAALELALGPEGADVLVTRDECFIVPSDGSVRAKRVTRLGALVLHSLPLPPPDADVVMALLLDAVRAEGLASLLRRDQEASELLARVSLLVSLQSAPGDWPDLGEEALGASMEEWLGASLLAAGSVKAVARLYVSLSAFSHTMPQVVQERMLKSVCALL
jgi:ATP-dependent helicase HrpB